MKKETDLQKRTREEKESHQGAPSTGVRSLPRKAQSETGQATPYAFPTDTKVTTAKDVPGKAKECADKQEGLNKSKLPMDTPPGGSKKEE